MATAFDLISSALRLAGVIAASEEPTTDEANDSLSVFNDMLDGWNSDRLAIYTIQSNDFPFVLGQQTYTMGIGGDFNIPRPARITGMSAILLTNPANPIEEPIYMCSVDYWQVDVPVKQVISSFPQVCYDDGNFPLRNLNFWPIPQLQQNNVRIYSWQPLAAPSTLQTAITFPPGYAEAFRYNLAVRLAAEFKSPPDETVIEIAKDSLARIKTMNAPDLSLTSDLVPSPAGYNYKADMFGIPF